MADQIDEKYIEKMRDLARFLDGMLNDFDQEGSYIGPRKVGFALLVFEPGDRPSVNYISNCERRDILVAMKEFVAHHEGRVVSAETKQ